MLLYTLLVLSPHLLKSDHGQIHVGAPQSSNMSALEEMIFFNNMRWREINSIIITVLGKSWLHNRTG
jgi:hypothetical protein